MNLGQIKDFNRYVYSILHVGESCPPQKLNPSTSLLSGPLRQSPLKMQHITKASAWVQRPRGQDPPTSNINISTKIFDLT